MFNATHRHSVSLDLLHWGNSESVFSMRESADVDARRVHWVHASKCVLLQPERAIKRAQPPNHAALRSRGRAAHHRSVAGGQMDQSRSARCCHCDGRYIHCTY